MTASTRSPDGGEVCGWCGVPYSPDLDGKACDATVGFIGVVADSNGEPTPDFGPTGPHQWTSQTIASPPKQPATDHERSNRSEG